jgi:glycine cleavage system H protein
MARPKDAKYSESHEWVKVDKKGEAVIGITDYAVAQLNDLVHIELPKSGADVSAGQPFGEIESVKTVSDLVSPVTGKISAVNSITDDTLDTLAKSPFDDGWLIKVKGVDAKELKSLMTDKEYDKFIKESEHHDGGGHDEDGDDEA